MKMNWNDTYPKGIPLTNILDENTQFKSPGFT
jgi:hypothetical protein